MVDCEPRDAPPGAVLVLDGLFLHRDELFGAWHFSVFLDVPFAETVRRLAARDGSIPDAEHPSLRRYVQAQLHYLATCAPRERASRVVDDADTENPTISPARRGDR